MNKRGISAVVATVLIILITVSAVVIIWASIIPLIQENLEFASLEGSVEIVSSNGYTYYNLQEKVLYVQVKQISGDTLSKVKILVSSNGNTITNETFDSPGKNNYRVYEIDLSKFSNLRPDEISLVPIYFKNNKEIEGRITSSFDKISIINKVSEDLTLPSCGDGTCSPEESCSTCSSDCGTCTESSVCGDLICSQTESCSTCPGDCGTCQIQPSVCGNNLCELDEDQTSCSADCPNLYLKEITSYCSGFTPVVNLSWTSQPGATSYRVYWDRRGTFIRIKNSDESNELSRLDWSSHMNPYDFVSAGTTNTYRIQAKNGLTTIANSNEASVIFPECSTDSIPSSPTNLVAIYYNPLNKAGGGYLTWNHPDNLEDGFIVERSWDGLNFEIIGTGGDEGEGYRIGPGRNFFEDYYSRREFFYSKAYYRVRAYNYNGFSSHSSVVSLDYTPYRYYPNYTSPSCSSDNFNLEPAKVTRNNNQGEVSLYWGCSIEDSTYEVQRKTSSGSFITISQMLNERIYLDKDAQEGKINEYRIKKNSPSGTTYSNVVQIEVPNFVLPTYAYLMTGKGLIILDVSNKQNPSLVGQLNSINLSDIEIVGNTAYITSSSQSKIFIIDISNKQNPSLIDSIQDPSLLEPSGIEIRGDIVYVAANKASGIGALTLVNLTNKNIISSFSRSPETSNPNHMSLFGDNLYFSPNGFHLGSSILDISNPSSISIKGFIREGAVAGGPLAVEVRGKYVYLSQDTDKLVIIDISNPSRAKYIGFANMPASWSIDLNGDYLYSTGHQSKSCDEFGGFYIYDISSPTTPLRVGKYEDYVNHGCFKSLKSAGNYAYVLSDGRFDIFDVSNPSNPTIIGSFEDQNLLEDADRMEISN